VKIDAFSHVRPRAYAEIVERLVGSSAGMARFVGGGAASARPALAPLWDASLRIRHLDDAEVDKQVITHTVPPIEQAAADPDVAAQLAIASNNAVLDMANAHPDRFIPIGTVAMNDVEAACKEAERCLTRLGMKGILIYTNHRQHQRFGRPARGEGADVRGQPAPVDRGLKEHRMTENVYSTAYLSLAVPLSGDLLSVPQQICRRYALMPRSEVHLTLAFFGQNTARKLVDLAGALLDDLPSSELGQIGIDGFGGAY
jgi:hypothetical protein